MSCRAVGVVGASVMLALATAAPIGAEPAGNAVGAGAVASSPPVTTVTPDGWQLTVSAKDETQVAVLPLTTSTASRDYIVGGTFSGSVTGHGRSTLNGGKLEVGYQIGCGIVSPPVGVILQPEVNPLIPTDFLTNALVNVALRPGELTIVPIAKKEFKGTDSQVTIGNYDIHTDTCIGQSFIRSYATLTVMTDSADDVVSYVGVTRSE